MARREPAAVKSRIQFPSLISQIMMPPAMGLPWMERGGDRERVEEIDVETPFTPPYAPGAQCDRIGVPQHQRHVDGAHDGIEAESHQQR